MKRGTTPTHIFTIPFEVEQIADLRISYGQADKEILSKKKDDCELNGRTISVTLTQNDTFKFNCAKTAAVEVRILTTSGQVLSSAIIPISVDKCLNSEVLTI